MDVLNFVINFRMLLGVSQKELKIYENTDVFLQHIVMVE